MRTYTADERLRVGHWMMEQSEHQRLANEYCDRRNLQSHLSVLLLFGNIKTKTDPTCKR